MNLAHQYCALVPLIAARAQPAPPSLPEVADGFAQPATDPQLLSETMILPALSEVEAYGEEQDESCVFPPAPFQPENLHARPRRVGRWWYKHAIILTLLLLGAIIASVMVSHRGRVQKAIQQQAVTPPAETAPINAQVLNSDPTLAVITATAGATGEGGDAINPRTELVVGRSLNLTGGAVELTYATGATVVVRAPAQVRLTDRNTLALDAGSVYAHVPPSAIGFRVVAPGLGVTDRGTNFGVRIKPDNSGSEVHVFEGRVDAAALDEAGNTNGPPVPVTTGGAVAHSTAAPDQRLVPIQFQAGAFDRDINRIQVEVPSHGTGAGVDAGFTDPQWQLVSVPNIPGWRTRPATVVIDPRPEYVPNTPKAKWISTAPHMDNVAGGNYVYRTTIDLTGFDPASVSAQAAFAVDDKIHEIRINGAAASLPNELTDGIDTGAARTMVHHLPLSNVKWLSGPNQVDVVVWNLTGGPNFTGLQLSWNISAAPLVKR